MAGSVGDHTEPVRVFISYAHGDRGHEHQVWEFWLFLRTCGVDARLDLAETSDRVDWAQWMTREVEAADRLAAADPGNTEWQRDLSVSRDKLGNMAVAAGDLAAARSAYQASLDIRTRLAATDPANAQWQRDLAWARQAISNLDG